MTDFAGITAIILFVSCIILMSTAHLIRAWQKEELQADLRYIRAYFRLNYRHYKHRFNRRMTAL